MDLSGAVSSWGYELRSGWGRSREHSWAPWLDTEREKRTAPQMELPSAEASAQMTVNVMGMQSVLAKVDKLGKVTELVLEPQKGR